MEHSVRMVDVLDQQGNVIGQKHRYDVNKATDIYHAIFVFLITPWGEIVLGVIPSREDLPNFYARKMGATVGTIRRSGETALQAATRGVQRELFIDSADLHLLGDLRLDLPENRTTFSTSYYMIGNPPPTYSLLDIDTLAVVTPHQMRNLMISHSDELAPTLQLIWEKFHSKLPI